MGLRIGQIDYANCFPIFSALQKNFDCSAYRFVRGTPSALNQKLLAGDIDLCPSSSIAYARSAQSLRLIPDLSISSVGAVKSVKLFSRIPLEKLNRTLIGLTVESETSIALLKIILKKFYRFTNEFIPVKVDESSVVGDACPAITRNWRYGTQVECEISRLVPVRSRRTLVFPVPGFPLSSRFG